MPENYNDNKNENNDINMPDTDEIIKALSLEDTQAEDENISENDDINVTDDITDSNEQIDNDDVTDQSPADEEIYEESSEETYDETIEESDDEIIEYDDNEEDDDYAESYDAGVLNSLSEKIHKFIDDFKKNEPKKKAKILILTSLCFMLVVLILTDFIPILPNAYNRFYVGNSYVIGETQGGVYDKIGKNIIYAGNGTVMSFGPDMSCKFKIDSVIGIPRLETDGKNAIVYYKNSPEALLVTDSTNHKTLKMPETITAASINRNGYYSLVTDEPGYESCVNVFSPNGSSIYKWHTNNHIIDSSVSYNGKSMVTASYTIDKKHISGKLIFFDLGKDSPVKEVSTSSNVISEVKFIGDDVVVAFGDIYTAAYTSSGAMKWRIDYAGRTPKSYDVNNDGEIGFIFDRYSSELSESTVEIYGNNGRLMGKYQSKDNVKYISANNSCFLLSLDRKTVLLDNDADVMEKNDTNKDFRKAVLYYNYNFAFSVSDSVAEILSVNH